MTFDSMFRAIHGYDPFPWQSEAARRLVAADTFTGVNVPTASGKTAMIDVAVYTAAQGGPRRIAFIIDRRVVVDEAYSRAQRIAKAFAGPDMKEFATSLGPIQVVQLRGGVYGDDDWVFYPDRLTIIISTIDQVGSRLLHRGYGVSPRMASLHAGFVGNNALYIVDEAHLSTPFVETVKAAQGHGADVRLITMTATPVAETAGVVELTAEDRSHPILKKRFKASKQARLFSVPDNEDDFVKKALVEIKNLAETARVIGVVVNRVSTARRIWKSLNKDKQRAELLTGRIRPYDRDRLMERLLPEIQAGRVRKEGAPLFLVATQTIEVGADLDFDALFTEAAPLDALRQRFGRLDRLGELGITRGTILYRPKLDENKKELPDAIYGTAIHDTWKWLKKVAKEDSVDFGILALEKSIRKIEPSTMEPKHAPVLLPAHITLLGQTGGEAPYLDVSSWLHGAQSGSADVSLVWRADLLPDSTDLWAQIVALRQPLTQETLEVPIFAARAWLEGLRVPEVTDLEGLESFTRTRGNAEKPILLWRGTDDSRVVYPEDIRPGDILILPSNYGGCDSYGWNPKSSEPVEDIADFCSLERQKDHVVRLVPELTGWLGKTEGMVRDAVMEVIASETEVDLETGIDHDRVKASHKTLRGLLAEVKHPLLDFFQGQYEIERHPLGLALRSGTIDEIETILSGGVEVTLDQHLEGVANLVDSLTVGHPERERILIAARHHDLGKKEPRFQLMLHGNPLDAASGPILAKSGLRKVSERRAAYAESGLPKGFRHELASLDFIGSSDLVEFDMLVRHLIATHHGFGRPWFPACADPESPGVVHIPIGSGWVRSFAALLAHYGPWGLADLELLLRSSDVRQSIKEQEETVG